MSDRCPRCIQRGTPASMGSPIRCAFIDGVFSADNWNCATMNALRDYAETRRVYGADESAALLRCDPDTDGGFIAMVWYKNRGTTTGAFWLREQEEDTMVPLPLAVAERCLRHQFEMQGLHL